MDRAAVRYDRDGDQHYDVASALIKSIRGSDVDAALHYLARMIEAGEDPRFIARRLVISASEDIGLADPTALPTRGRRGAGGRVDRLPRGGDHPVPGHHRTARSPRSPTPRSGDRRRAGGRAPGLAGPVPPHLRDAHYSGRAKLGHGAGLRVPARPPGGVAAQQYAPDAVAGREYYRPATTAPSGAPTERLARLRGVLRGTLAPAAPAADDAGRWLGRRRWCRRREACGAGDDVIRDRRPRRDLEVLSGRTGRLGDLV